MIRFPGCRACEQITSGDCGMHGPIFIPTALYPQTPTKVVVAEPIEALAAEGLIASPASQQKPKTQRRCTEACWTPVRCPTCGNRLAPRGRSVAVAMNEPTCCAEARYSAMNPRHLWDEHDSTRYYTDPEGWAEHEGHCEHCSGANE